MGAGGGWKVREEEEAKGEREMKEEEGKKRKNKNVPCHLPRVMPRGQDHGQTRFWIGMTQ